MHNSNNTAELSAVPHAMIDYIQWRRRSNRRGIDGIEVRTTELVGMVMVYDSQYTCDACVTRRNRDALLLDSYETFLPGSALYNTSDASANNVVFALVPQNLSALKSV